MIERITASQLIQMGREQNQIKIKQMCCKEDKNKTKFS